MNRATVAVRLATKAGVECRPAPAGSRKTLERQSSVLFHHDIETKSDPVRRSAQVNSDIEI